MKESGTPRSLGRPQLPSSAQARTWSRAAGLWVLFPGPARVHPSPFSRCLSARAFEPESERSRQVSAVPTSRRRDSLGPSPTAPPGDPADRFYLSLSGGGYRPNSRPPEKAGVLPHPPSHPSSRFFIFLPDTPEAAESKDPAQQLVEHRLQRRVWNCSTQNTNTSHWHVLRNATVGWLRNQNRPNGEARRESNWPSSVGEAARVTLSLPVSIVGVCCCVNYSSSRSRRREQPLWKDFKWNVPLGGKQLPSSPAGEGFPPGSTWAAVAARLPARCAPPASLSPSGFCVQLRNRDPLRPGPVAHVPGPAEADQEQIGWLFLGRTFQCFWFSQAFQGAPGVEVGHGGPPVSSLDGQDEGGSEGIRDKSDIVRKGGKYMAL